MQCLQLYGMFVQNIHFSISYITYIIYVDIQVISIPGTRAQANGRRRGPQARLSGPMRGVHIPTNRPSDWAATHSNNMHPDPYSRFFVECAMCIPSCAPIPRWDACWRRHIQTNSLRSSSLNMTIKLRHSLRFIFHRCAWRGSRVWTDVGYMMRLDVECGTCLDGTCAAISAIHLIDARGLSWSSSAARTAVARVDDD